MSLKHAVWHTFLFLLFKKKIQFTRVKPPLLVYQLVSGLVHSLKWNHLFTEEGVRDPSVVYS